MENKPNTTALPDLGRAMMDLDRYERAHAASEEKLKISRDEVENLMMKNQALKRYIDEQKRILKYFTKLHVEEAAKVERTSISNNKAILVEAKNQEKIKQVEAKTVENAFNSNIYDFQIQQGAGLEARKEVLLLEKQKLEQTIDDNKKYMKELIYKIKEI